MQCWEISAKYWLSGSSKRADAKSRRAAAMSDGEARWVIFEGMKRFWKMPPGETTEEVGSAWI